MKQKFRASLLTVALLTVGLATATFVKPALAHDDMDGMDMNSGGSGDTGAMGQQGALTSLIISEHKQLVRRKR